MQYGKDNNKKSETGIGFNVIDKLVCGWRKCVAQLRDLPKTMKASRGRSTPYAADETALRDTHTHIQRERERVCVCVCVWRYCNSLDDKGSDTTDVSCPFGSKHQLPGVLASIDGITSLSV